jgi:hypothetical protein
LHFSQTAESPKWPPHTQSASFRLPWGFRSGTTSSNVWSGKSGANGVPPSRRGPSIFLSILVSLSRSPPSPIPSRDITNSILAGALPFQMACRPAGSGNPFPCECPLACISRVACNGLKPKSSSRTPTLDPLPPLPPPLPAPLHCPPSEPTQDKQTTRSRTNARHADQITNQGKKKQNRPTFAAISSPIRHSVPRTSHSFLVCSRGPVHLQRHENGAGCG